MTAGGQSASARSGTATVATDDDASDLLRAVMIDWRVDYGNGAQGERVEAPGTDW